MTQQNGIL